MNEEALKDAYNQFANTGYDGDQNEFYTLLSENSEAFADSYGLFKGSGYDGSEDDYKTLLGLKKKDDSVVSSILPQTGSEDTPLQSELSQPSLEETSQNSLEERFSGYMDMPDEDKFKLAKQEDKRPFYESQGVDYDKFLLAKQEEEEVISTNEEQEEEDEESSWAGKWYDRLSNWSEYDEEQTELAEKDTSSRMYLAKNKEGIKSADLDYDNALFQSIIKNSKSSKQFAKAIQESGIDQNNIRMPEMQIDGQDASMNEWIDYWLDSDNVSTQKSIAEENEDYDEAVNGGMDPEEASEKFLKTKAPNYSITVDENFSDNPNYKSLEYAKNLMNRQLESGGMIGDWGQNLLATTIDLGAGLIEQMEKVPAGLGLKPSPLADAKKFENLSSWELYMQEGGYYANKVQGYANQVRELTRIPEEQSIAESFLEGNYSDVLFNAGNGVANAIPFTLAVAATGGGTAGLILGGASAGGMKSLELKERRRGGEDIDNWQIHFSEGVTAVSEGFFEKYTQGIIRSARKAGGLKAISDPNVLLDSYLKGIKKAILTEVPSEVATEATQYLTDAIPAVGLEEFDAGEFAVRMVDTAIISTLFGGGTYVTVRGAKEISRNLGVINKNTSVIFTNEKGEKKEMSRGEAVNLARDPEIAQQIRDGKLKVDYSMNDVAREAIDNLVYGESAPDAIAARSVMRNKEKAVQEILDKVQSSKKVDEKTGKEVNDVSTEDLKSLSEAITEMEAEGKVSKYNESETTVATRKKVQAILKEKGIEITNATQTQDVSTSKVTNTTEINKINTEEEYRSIKKQVKDKRIPKVVTSETQKGITVKGEVVQESEVTQGKFKNIAAAKNAIKEYKAKVKAAKDGMMVEDDLFPANNRLFTETNKDSLDEVPQEVLDSKEYYVLTSEKEGLTADERGSRMVELKSMLDKAGAKYYTVQGVYNGVAEESLVVTGLNEGQALTIGRQFGQESIFSAEKGLMFSNGAVVPLNGDAVEGVDARKRDALTIMNVGGKKVSLHTGLDWGNMSHGKNFNSDNIHRLDDSDPNYDKELFEGVTEDRKRILGFAFKLLNSIGGLNVTVIRNSEAMKAQIKSIQKARYIQDGMLEVEAETDSENYAEERKRGSFFVDKTIHINLETVQGNTLFHEIIHPMVDFIKDNDPALYKRIEQEVKESNVKRRTTLNGKKMKGSYLEWVQNNPAYKGLSLEGQIEEAFAEMMGDAAYGHFKNRQSKLNRIRGVIKAMLNKLGMTSLPENVEAIDLATMSLSDMNENLVGAFLDGRKITVGGVEFEVGETEAEPKFQLDAVDKRTGIQYTYDQNSKVFAEMEADGRITSGKTIQDFKGKKMMFHAPDAMFSGSIIDADGTILIEGKGGVMYPFVFNEEGYFWASTDNAAEKMAEQLNSMMDENDGKIYMALTTATQDKLLSSTAASRGILNLLSSENFIKKIGMNKSQLYKAVIEAANNVSTVTKTKIDKKTGEEVKSTKKIGLDLKLKPYRASSDFNSDIVEKIWSKLDNSTSSFDDRKNFSDKLLTNIKKFKVLESKSSKVNFVNFINTTDPSLDYSKFNKDGSGNINSLKKAIINVLTEPSLREKDGDTNRIYAVLEIDGPVKPINTKENPNAPDYESYGTAIVSESKNRTTIHRLDNRDFWYDVTEEPGTNAIIGGRERLSSSDKMSSIASQIMPSTAGVSTTPLKISEKIRMQVPQVEEVQWQESRIGRGDLAITNRSEEVREAAQDYFDRKITQQEHLDIVQENSPIKPITQFMNPASLKDIKTAVGSKVEGKLDVSIQEGTKVGVRLDISAYTNKNIWAITVHEDGRGKAMSYTNVARINNVEFISSPKVALNIARGKSSKATIARILGEWSPLEGADAKARGESAKQIVAEVMNDPSWSQIGMNPFRHSYFYDRLDGMPVVNAEQVVQIGGLVYAKNAEKTTPFDERFEDKRTGLRFQAPSYDMEYTPNALISLGMQDIEKANPTEWVSRISKGVKGSAKDVSSMGLLEVLTAYQKEAKVKSIPKEVVAQLIATNMAEIETTVLSGSFKAPPTKYDDYNIGYDGDNYSVETPDGQIFDTGEKASTEVEELDDYTSELIIDKVLIENDLFTAPQYSFMTIPGGENYREFLIKDKSSEDIFTAPHYDDFGENLIASVRADDRVGPNGEKVLFVQEIQSDWAQQGSKSGFKKEGEADSGLTQEQRLRYGRLLRYMDERSLTSDERMEFSNLERIDDLQEVARKKVPNLPWNQTDLWVGLAIRKVINQASKEGYDQIAFVNGEQSDIVQQHTGSNAGKTHEFYNKIVPKNIDKELKRLVKGSRYMHDLLFKEAQQNFGGFNVIINLTPELKAATDKVGPLRFQVNEEITDDQLQTIKSTYSDIKEKYPNINIDGDRINLYHYSNDNLESVDPDAAVMSSYSREEFKTWGRGRVFFYTDPNLKEGIVTSQVKNETSLPIDKVYPLTEDPLGLSDIALANIKEKRSGGNKTMSTITIDTKVLASANISISHFKAKLRGLGLADVVNFESVEENNSYAKNKDGKYVKDGVENVRLSVTYPEGSDNITSLIKETFDGSSFERINPATIPINTFEELAIAADNLGFQGFIYDHVGGKTVSSWKAVGVTKDRFQAAREEGETNNYTDGAFTIGWDISKALQDADYAAGRYLSGLIDQKSFKSKERQRYDIRLTTLLLKPIGTHSDKEVKEIMVRSRGSLNAELLEANLIKRRLEKANKEANLSPKEINDLLHNLNDVKAMEDSDIKMALLEMRAHVDRLSNTLISEGLIDGQTMFTVDANLGFYITKSYKNFEVKGWEQTDNLIIKKAKTFLYNEAKKDNPEASEDQLLNIVDKSFRKLTEDKEFAYNMRSSGSLDGLTRVSSIFEEKKVIPQEIKDLWGEIDNPLFNYNNTVKKLAQTVTAERMYRDILEIGKGRFISDTYDRNSTINELKGAKWGSLDGKFVDNEMFSVMNQMNPEGSEGSFAWVYDFYMNMVLFNKKMKTVWNPGTHVKNLVGNTAFATMNGHLNPLNPQMYKDGITSIKTVTGMKTPELQELYKKLTAKGVVSSSASLEEIRGIAKDLAQSDFDLSEYLDEKNGKVQKLAAKAKRAVGKPYNYLDKKFSKAYQAEDDVWKIFGYLSEKARYVKAGLTEKEADDMAARNIINLYPNYAEIPRAIRYIGRSPLVGSFVAFQAESVRNAKNTVVLGFEEMGSSNPKIRKIGATRIAGTIATMALLEGLQLYTLQFLSESLGLSGGDEEESEQRKIRTLVADWDKSGSLGYVDSGSLETKTNEDQMENDKYFDYINFSSISGVGYIKDIMRLAFEDIETQAGKESSFRIMEKVFAPFISEEMTLGAMLAAYNNEGGKVYNRTDDSLTKLSKMLMFVGDQIKPGVVSSGVRVYNSMDEDSDRVPLYETMALFGLRINRGNANKSLAINSRTAYNDMRERTDDNILRSKSLLQKELLVNPDLDNDLSIISDLMSAARLNKVAGEDTRTILKGMGVSNIVIDLAYNRMINNYKQDIINVDAK